MECIDNAEAPDGWIKWIIPSYEYIVVENHKGAFEETIRKMNEHGILWSEQFMIILSRQQERIICTFP